MCITQAVFHSINLKCNNFTNSELCFGRLMHLKSVSWFQAKLHDSTVFWSWCIATVRVNCQINQLLINYSLEPLSIVWNLTKTYRESAERNIQQEDRVLRLGRRTSNLRTKEHITKFGKIGAGTWHQQTAKTPKNGGECVIALQWLDKVKKQLLMPWPRSPCICGCLRLSVPRPIPYL